MAISKIESAALASGVPSRSQLPAGTVLQVVQSTATAASTSSTSFVDSGLSASITPTNVANKILVIISTVTSIGGGNDNGMGLRVVRGATPILVTDTNAIYFYTTLGGTEYIANSQSMNYLDSPATTSPTTYKLQFASQDSKTVNINFKAPATITLMEIAA